MPAEYTNVVIGIQARSGSTRFPKKVFEKINDKPMLQLVIDACQKAALYNNNFANRSKFWVNLALVVPFDDEILNEYKGKLPIIEGPEEDVLTRYNNLLDAQFADYIVRITSDCPLIPPFLITKHIKTALKNSYDYLSNVDEDCRTAIDGHDVEIISARLMRWAHETATDSRDREHVTTIIRRERPGWAKYGHIMGFMDLSNKKLSVDTVEDMERVKAETEILNTKKQRAESKHGKYRVHRV